MRLTASHWNAFPEAPQKRARARSNWSVDETQRSGRRSGSMNFSVLAELPEAICRGAVICTTPELFGLAENVTAHLIWSI